MGDSAGIGLLKRMRAAAVALALIPLSCCAGDPVLSRSERVLARTASGAAYGVREVVETPLRDLNVVKEPVAPVLLQAKQNPYGLERPADCAEVDRQIGALDLALGPDIDLPPPPGRRWKSVLTAAPGAAVDAALGLGTSLPVRGVARQLSGAARAERRRKAAILAGEIRRGFLKGVAAELGCDRPERAAALPRPPRLRLPTREGSGAEAVPSLRLYRPGDLDGGTAPMLPQRFERASAI